MFDYVQNPLHEQETKQCNKCGHVKNEHEICIHYETTKTSKMLKAAPNMYESNQMKDMFDEENNSFMPDLPREVNTVISPKIWKRHRKLELGKHDDV